MAGRGLIAESVAMVFPGQGSQVVGMGAELVTASGAARRVVEEADGMLGFPLSELMFRGPASELEDTINAQPAILTVSVAALAAVRERLAARGASLTPSVVAGHSLGEFTALIAADVLDFPAALRLVRERGRIMKEAGEESPGGMAAVLGLEDDALAAICAAASGPGVVVVANANCPGQTVISGDVAALEWAMALAKERGAKRVTRLGVSIASHSPLMTAAAGRFAELVAAMPLREPRLPVVGNVSARLLTTIEEIQDELSRQMASPVNWTGSVRAMIDAGVTVFLEIGPGQVLSGLIKRISREAVIRGIADLDLGLPAVVSR